VIVLPSRLAAVPPEHVVCRRRPSASRSPSRPSACRAGIANSVTPASGGARRSRAPSCRELPAASLAASSRSRRQRSVGVTVSVSPAVVLVKRTTFAPAPGPPCRSAAKPAGAPDQMTSSPLEVVIVLLPVPERDRVGAAADDDRLLPLRALSCWRRCPVIESLPAPPLITLLPASAVMVSLDPPPVSVSAPPCQYVTAWVSAPALTATLRSRRGVDRQTQRMCCRPQIGAAAVEHQAVARRAVEHDRVVAAARDRSLRCSSRGDDKPVVAAAGRDGLVPMPSTIVSAPLPAVIESLPAPPLIRLLRPAP